MEDTTKKDQTTSEPSTEKKPTQGSDDGRGSQSPGQPTSQQDQQRKQA